MLSPTAAERLGARLGGQSPGCCGVSFSKQPSCSVLLPDAPGLEQHTAATPANLDFNWKETVTEGKRWWWWDIKCSWAD